LCGGAQVEPYESDGRRQGFTLSFGVFACDNCSETFVNREGDTGCPRCGSVQESTDQHVQRRADGFGTDLVRLQERLEFAHDVPVAARGDRRSEDEYRAWMLGSLFTAVLEWSERLVPLMSRGDFNEPTLPETRAVWTDLLELANDIVDTALATQSRPGPVQLVATHHSLVAGLLVFASGVVGYLTTLTAPTPSVTQRRARDAQEMLDNSGTVLGRAIQLTNDDDALDSPSGRTAASVFPELAALAERDPVMLRPLLPMAKLCRRAHDVDRRNRRAHATVAVLNGTNAGGGRWLEPFAPFLNGCGAAWRRLVAQHERIVRALDEDRGRAGWVDDVLDIGSKLAEGPYRVYGGLLVVASKVAAGEEPSASEEAIVRFRGFSSVTKALEALDPVFVAGVESLLRNAEAHYDYELRADGVEIRHRPPRGGGAPLVDFLSFDDLLVSVLNLHEVSVAMAAGVLEWIWQTGTVGTREAFRRDWLTA
jgi:hypothetical protein